MQAVFPIGSPSIACLCPPITLRRALFFVMIVSLSFLIGISPIAVYRFTSGFQGCVTLMIGTIGTFRAWGSRIIAGPPCSDLLGLGETKQGISRVPPGGLGVLNQSEPSLPDLTDELGALDQERLVPRDRRL